MQKALPHRFFIISIWPSGSLMQLLHALTRRRIAVKPLSTIPGPLHKIAHFGRYQRRAREWYPSLCPCWRRVLRPSHREVAATALTASSNPIEPSPHNHLTPAFPACHFGGNAMCDANLVARRHTQASPAAVRQLANPHMPPPQFERSRMLPAADRCPSMHVLHQPGLSGLSTAAATF
jgi:hypothetical protein